MATGGYRSKASSASSGSDNASDDSCSEASSIYTSSSSDDECDAVTGCKIFTNCKKVGRYNLQLILVQYQKSDVTRRVPSFCIICNLQFGPSIHV